MPNASIEWSTPGERLGLLRVHPQGGAGDPWTFGCVVRDLKNGRAELQLAATLPKPSEARAIWRALKAAGFDATWQRRNTKLDRVTVVKRRVAPAIGAESTKGTTMAQAQKEESKLSVSIRMKAIGGDGFFHTAEVDYLLTRESFEAVQRAISEALMGLQRTAETE